MSDFDTLHSTIRQTVQDQINLMREVPASEVGLDSRCGYIYVGKDCIAVPTSNVRSLEYYGGIEYCDSECMHVLGDYKFYVAQDESRVQSIIDRVFGEEEDDGEE